MHSTARRDVLDTSVVLKSYAVASWIAGVLLYAWGPLLFRLQLSAYPYGTGVAARVTGAALVAAGCFAWAAARVVGPWEQRQVLTWWAVGHTSALVLVVTQVITVFGNSGLGPGLWLGWLITWTAVFWYQRATVEGMPWGRRTAVNRAPSVKELRSTYEQQIRTAAAQEERNRLARDLHDSIKQQIFVIQTAAATAQARFDTDTAGAVRAIEQVRLSAREAMTEMEVMLDQLRAAPLENAGLVEALKKQCEALRFRTGADVRFIVGDLPPNESLAPGAHDTVFRVAQEALANVARHARATRVKVSLEGSPYNLQLRVDDDGTGFEPVGKGPGMGLGNMRERAATLGATLAVTSEPGQGTLVRLSVPRALHVPELRDYRRLMWFWGSLLASWIWMTSWWMMRSERFLLAYGIPLVVVHALLFARAAAAYASAKREQTERTGAL